MPAPFKKQNLFKERVQSFCKMDNQRKDDTHPYELNKENYKERASVIQE